MILETKAGCCTRRYSTLSVKIRINYLHRNRNHRWCWCNGYHKATAASTILIFAIKITALFPIREEVGYFTVARVLLNHEGGDYAGQILLFRIQLTWRMVTSKSQRLLWNLRQFGQSKSSKKIAVCRIQWGSDNRHKQCKRAWWGMGDHWKSIIYLQWMCVIMVNIHRIQGCRDDAKELFLYMGRKCRFGDDFWKRQSYVVYSNRMTEKPCLRSFPTKGAASWYRDDLSYSLGNQGLLRRSLTKILWEYREYHQTHYIRTVHDPMTNNNSSL